MWSSIMSPSGHSVMPNVMPMKQQQREFGMLFPSLPIATGKSFKNPNFVNNFNQYQSTVKPVDSSTKNYQNYCHSHTHSHIIDSIKERCPEIIPSVEEDTTACSETPAETSSASPAMCHSNNQNKSFKREHFLRRKKQSGKHSKHNQQRKEIKEMLQEADIQDVVGSLTDICSSPRIPILHFEDFMIQKPSPNICSPSKMMVQSIEIPISNAEMVLTISKAAPSSQSRRYSVTDSEDSFIIFDHEYNEHLKGEDKHFANKESLCNRLRKPSVCDSEDSFILFEHGDTASQDDESDYCFDSSDEETDQESNCHSDWQNEDSFDEIDSSFSIVQPKKVRFASDHKLCEVHPMIMWSYAYQAARKGPWEMYARDRCRFRERAYTVEREIKHIFDPQHREKIYKERFENL